MQNTRIVKIPLNELVDSYKESLGDEGANQLIKESIQAAGYRYQQDYTKEEAIKILQVLERKDGFVGILAGILLPRIIIRN